MVAQPQLSIHLGQEQVPISIEVLSNLLVAYKAAQESSVPVGPVEPPSCNIQTTSNYFFLVIVK